MGINRSCPFLFWTLGFRRLAEVRAASCGKHTAKSTAPAILLTKIQLIAQRAAAGRRLGSNGDFRNNVRRRLPAIWSDLKRSLPFQSCKNGPISVPAFRQQIVRSCGGTELLASRYCDLGKQVSQEHALKCDRRAVINYRDRPLLERCKIRSGRSEIRLAPDSCNEDA